jgi:predicted 3-demethylubiquinone-9 3-methyltransferase (glyoxalase superfamily)
MEVQDDPHAIAAHRGATPCLPRGRRRRCGGDRPTGTARCAPGGLGIPLCRETDNMQKITPFLWFDDNLEEAVSFYVSIFKNSKIVNLTRHGDGGPAAKGTVITAKFILDGQEFMALQGGPQFSFTPAISFFVNCETQEEVDELWEKLSEGGKKERCGWLKDKYGLSWQIIPAALGQMMGDKDPAKAQRVMQAMLQMDKIDIKKLKEAYEQK